jgi:hypothetical protein
MRVWNSRSGPTILATALFAGPILVNVLVIAAAQEPRWMLAFAISGAALLGLAFVYRVRLWKSIRQRVLHARPTDHCRLCGYSSAGLDATRVDTGTLAFEQSRCPECGRPNPR